MPLEIISGYSLDSNELTYQIREKTKEQRHLILCASQMIKEARISNPLFEAATPYKKGESRFTVATFLEFESFLQQDAYRNDNIIRVSDERFILSKIIEYTFKDNSKRLNMFTELRFKLYELFAYLSFNDISITNKIVNCIGDFYSDFESDIFSLYLVHTKVINELIMNNVTDEMAKILGDDVFIGINGLDIINNLVKTAIKKHLKDLNVLVLDGFIIYDHFLKYIIKEALKQQKQVYLTIKHNDTTNLHVDFIFPKLFEELNQPYEKPTPIKLDLPCKTALEYLQQNYDGMPNADNSYLLEDGTITFITPFQNRETEWQYIVEQISLILEKEGGDDIQKLKDILKNDVIVYNTHRGYSELFIPLLKEVGLFIFKGRESLESLPFCVNEEYIFKDVYFRRNDFLTENITYDNKNQISYTDKLRLFTDCFECITVNTPRLPITEYPIGQYIFKIYNILRNGLNVSDFKTILYSNWQYAIQGGAKWDQFLNDFKLIEVFYEQENVIDSWIKITDELITIKDFADNINSLRYHPLYIVSLESLEFFKELLELIRQIVEKIGLVSGNIYEHIDVMKDIVIGELPHWEEASFEQKIVMDLIDIINNVTGSPLIKNMSAHYFSENIHAMFKDYELEIEDNPNGLILNVEKFINITHYKYCFFPLFEANKYPRKHFADFLFNYEVSHILQDPKFGMNLSLQTNDISNHLRMEDYHIKNVIDLTTEKLIITMTEKEDEHHNSISHYAHDITTLFDSDIPWKYGYPEEYETPSFFNAENIPALNIHPKESYTLREILNFLLCPRLFLHHQAGSPVYTGKFQLQFYFSAILFSETMREFCQYNRTNKVIYHVNGTEAAERLETLFEPVYKHFRPFFSMFSEYELLDIRNTALNRLVDSVTDMPNRGVKGPRYTVLDIKDDTIFTLDGFDLELEYDTKIYDLDNRKVTRVSQNSIFIDFLTLKTTDNKKESGTRYRQMKTELDQRSRDTDRVNLVYRILSKINVQFDSGNKSFMYGKDSGAERVNEIMDEIKKYNFSYARAYPSGYCPYCPVRNICKE